jgi:hypothetical protein
VRRARRRLASGLFAGVLLVAAPQAASAEPPASYGGCVSGIALSHGTSDFTGPAEYNSLFDPAKSQGGGGIKNECNHVSKPPGSNI